MKSVLTKETACAYLGDVNSRGTSSRAERHVAGMLVKEGRSVTTSEATRERGD